MADFSIKQNGRLPGIETQLDAPSAHLASAVEFHMKQVASGTPATKTGPAVITDASTPNRLIVRYDWGINDTDTIGRWQGEWWLTIGGLLLKLPNDSYLDIEVLDDAA
jgi:hypothetical protein